MSKSKGKSAKRGLSMEEKTEKIAQWWGRHCQEPFTLKELMSLLPKQTGVIFQSIEEIMELLVSENVVQQEKIGVHTLFWSFPKTEYQKEHSNEGGGGGGNGPPPSSKNTRDHLKQSLLDTHSCKELMQTRDVLLTQYSEASQQYQLWQTKVGTNEELKAINDVLFRLSQQKRAIELRRCSLLALDPNLRRRVEDSNRTAWEAANRWTDNYLLLEEEVLRKMSLNRSSFRKELNVPEKMEYIEVEDIQAWIAEERRKGEKKVEEEREKEREKVKGVVDMATQALSVEPLKCNTVHLPDEKPSVKEEDDDGTRVLQHTTAATAAVVAVHEKDNSNKTTKGTVDEGIPSIVETGLTKKTTATKQRNRTQKKKKGDKDANTSAEVNNNSNNNNGTDNNNNTDTHSVPPTTVPSPPSLPEEKTDPVESGFPLLEALNEASLVDGEESENENKNKKGRGKPKTNPSTEKGSKKRGRKGKEAVEPLLAEANTGESFDKEEEKTRTTSSTTNNKNEEEEEKETKEETSEMEETNVPTKKVKKEAVDRPSETTPPPQEEKEMEQTSTPSKPRARGRPKKKS